MRALKDLLAPELLRLVWPLAVAQIVSWGSMVYSFPLLLGPMERDLGWSRTEITGAFSLSLLVAGGAAFAVGWWIDRRGGYAPMTLGSLAAAGLFLLWSQTTSLWMFYAIWIGFGVVMAATLYEPVFAVLVVNFGKNARKSITLMTLIAGFAGTVFYPTTQALIEGFGWRDTLLVLALFNLVICGGIHHFVLRHSVRGETAEDIADGGAEAVGHRLAGERTESTSPLAAAIRRPNFWFIAVAFTANALVLSALTIHAIPLLGERGFATALIISVMVLVGPMQVAGRLVFAIFERRIGYTLAGIVTLLLPVAALLLLGLVRPGSLWVFAYPLLFGTAAGVGTIIRASAVPEFIGTAGYGRINGVLALPSTVARAAGPAAAAAIWAAAGGYDLVLWLLTPVALLSVLCFYLASRGR